MNSIQVNAVPYHPIQTATVVVQVGAKIFICLVFFPSPFLAIVHLKNSVTDKEREFPIVERGFCSQGKCLLCRADLFASLLAKNSIFLNRTDPRDLQSNDWTKKFSLYVPAFLFVYDKTIHK